MFFEEGETMGVTKSALGSFYKVINWACFSPRPLLPGRMESFLFSTTLTSLWDAGSVDIREKLISWGWRNGPPLRGFDWLPLGEDLLRGVWPQCSWEGSRNVCLGLACVILKKRSNKWSTQAKVERLAHSVYCMISILGGVGSCFAFHFWCQGSAVKSKSTAVKQEIVQL